MSRSPTRSPVPLLRRPALGLLCVVLLCAAAVPARADLNADLGAFFNEFSGLLNVTDPGIYQGQAAGYYSGGGLHLRVPQRSYRLFSLQTPRFRTGCGGIDLYAGGFSLINSDELVAMLRNVGQAAVSYAFLLALRTISPQISSTIERLQEWAQRFNLGNIDSCEAGARLAGAVAEQFGMQQSACIMERIATMGEDYAEARRACTTGGGLSGSLNRAQADPALAALSLEGNLSWRALMQNEYFRNDLELAQVAMNLTGTVLVRRIDPASNDPALEFRLVPSILGSPAQGGALFRQLIEGGEAGSGVRQLQRCIWTHGTPSASGSDCLQVAPALTPLRITPADSMKSRVRTLLNGIGNKIRTDRRLDAREQGLLQSVTLPVYKYLTVLSAYQYVSADEEIERYATLIARDLILSYLRELLGHARSAASLLGSRRELELVRIYENEIGLAIRALNGYGRETGRRFDEMLQLSTQMRLYERLLTARLSPALHRSALWQVSGLP